MKKSIIIIISVLLVLIVSLLIYFKIIDNQVMPYKEVKCYTDRYKRAKQIWSNMPSLETVNTKVFVFKNVNVAPMDENRILKSQTVIIKNGKIDKIGNYSNTNIPEDAHVVEGEGKLWLMPGLIDGYVHVADAEDLIMYIANGVTSVRHFGAMKEYFEFKNDILINEIDGPTLFLTGSFLFRIRPDGMEHIAKRVLTKEDAVRIVREEVAMGYDYICVIDIIDGEVYETIINEARKYNIPVVGFVSQEIGLSRVLKNRQHSVEFFSDYEMNVTKSNVPIKYYWDFIYSRQKLNDIISKTVESEVWNCFSLLGWKIYYVTKEQIKEHNKWAERKYIQSRYMYLPARVSKERQELTMRNVTYLVKRLHKAKANLAIGTGSAYSCVVPGFSMRRELELLVKSGFTPYEALRMATFNGAKLLKKDNLIGTISEGKSADLVMLYGNPLDNIENIRKQVGVMTRGKWYPQAELKKALKFVEAINSRKY